MTLTKRRRFLRKFKRNVVVDGTGRYHPEATFSANKFSTFAPEDANVKNIFMKRQVGVTEKIFGKILVYN